MGWRYGNDETGVVVDNDGLGPALIRNVVLTVDERQQHDAISAVQQIISTPAAEVHIDAVMRGVVIRSGHSLNLFVVRGTTPSRELRTAQSRLNLQICYCSILEQCWTNSLAGSIPRRVSECANNDAKELGLPRILAPDPPP